MVAVNIKSVGQMLQKKITFGLTKCLSKKMESFVIHRYSIKMCFLHTYILEKYFKDKLTIYYISSVHAHRYHANLRNTDVLGQNGWGKVNRFRPTHYGIGISQYYSRCYSISS